MLATAAGAEVRTTAAPALRLAEMSPPPGWNGPHPVTTGRLPLHPSWGDPTGEGDVGVWSFLRQFMYTKWVIVVDDDIDARNWKDVMWALSTRMDPARDITVIENTPIDYLDFASPVSGLGSKIGLDATDKFPGETNREWGRQIRMEQPVIDKVDAMWSELGLPGSGKKIWR